MLDAKTFIKLPRDFKGKFMIYPPSINEVVGNDEFGMYQKIFTISQEELEDDFVKQGASISDVPTPYEYLFSSCFAVFKIFSLR